MKPKVIFEKLDERAVLPKYAKEGDSGMDLVAIEGGALFQNQPAVVSTGLRIQLPPGYEAQIRPRSGLASRGVMAAFGTIDEGYRGELKVTLYNFRGETLHWAPGDRIAQLVIVPIVRADIEEGVVDQNTERGTGGFGSTG